MDLHLNGKTAVVTGASKGIGLVITQALVAEGALRGSAKLDRLAERGQVRPIQVDLTTPDGPTSLVAQAVEAFGGLDVLVNNVGAVRPRVDGLPPSPTMTGPSPDHQLDGRRPNHASRDTAPARTHPIDHRHRRVCQRVPA